MDIDSAVQRYLSNPNVATWLFSTDQITTITSQALNASFVYSIGFGHHHASKPRTMNIEDMLILSGISGSFVMGFIWGLNQPHVFAKTPLMLDKQPLARRFAIDMSAQDSLEFMEFVSFQDGKMIVMFRKFLHTHDQSLPVVACARLHAASHLTETLGPLLMRADLFEAACCPVCAQVGRRCLCTFDSYAPNTLVRKSTFNWNQFSSRFMYKARTGMIKLRMTAVLPNVGEMCIVDDEIPTVNVLQKGSTHYMNLLRRKAVHGLGINVVMPRTDSQILATSTENDFLDLHNSYISRKRVRELSHRPSDNVLLELDKIELPPTILPASDSVPGSPYPSHSLRSPNDKQEFGLPVGIYETADSHPEGEIPLEVIQQPSELIQTPDMDNNTFVRYSSEAAMKTVLDPNFPSTPPLTASPTCALIRDNDIMRGIEEILSPVRDDAAETTPRNGAETDRATADGATADGATADGATADGATADGATADGATADGAAADGAADGATTDFFAHRQDVPQKETSPLAVQWTSSISSEDSGTYATPRNQAVPKRPKRVRAPPETRNLTSQTMSDSSAENDKRHVCTTCSSRFKMRGDLLRHVKTVHEGKKMYTCQTCGKAFGHSGHLNRHVSSVHLQQRRFRCQFCGFQFFQASHLQSHIGHIHSVKKPYECKFCGVRVSTESALKSHTAKVKCAEAISSQSMSCSVGGCDSKFANIPDLAAHLALVHQALVEDVIPSQRFQDVRGLQMT